MKTIPKPKIENQDELEYEEFWTDSDLAESDEPQEIQTDNGRRTRTRKMRLPEKYIDFV